MGTTDKRKVILAALEKVLKDRRYDEVTMDKVAEEAKVGKGTVYRYFADKEDLFFQMVLEFLKDEFDTLSVVAASSRPTREKLVKIGEAISDHIQQHGRYMRMMHAQGFRAGRGHHDVVREHHERMDRVLLQLFDDLMTASDRMDAAYDRQVVLCMYKGMIMERTMRLMRHEGEVAVDQLVALLISGLQRK